LIVGNQANFDPVIAFLLWENPEFNKKFEAAFLKSYPTDWISDSDRQDRLAKLDAEIRAINVELCGMYDDMIEADLDFVPIEQIDPAVFLGLED
jgi:hypothetical protein